MSTYVLVPGAWLGAWAWQDVAARLRSLGHTVYPLSLTGLADRAGEGGPQVDLDAHAADITGLIDAEGLDEVILVGHSYGGAGPVTVAAHRIGDRLSHVVYVDCAPLDDGEAMIGSFDSDSAFGMREQVKTGDGWGLPFPGTERLGNERLRAGLTPDALQRLDRLATPHPFGTFTQPADRSGSPAGHPTPVMVACADIGGLLAANNPWITGLLGPEWLRFDLDTGHWPLLSEPGPLADILASIPGRATSIAEW